jgi:pyrimidine-nucleoside phosphorylase
MPGALIPSSVIARKRDGFALTRGEIASFVQGATDGSWADYQLGAMLMAIYLRGMTPAETAELTSAVVNSGRVADLSGVRAPKVDKHSTGGVGDKISLHLAPMVAACGACVPMVSGRGLGHTGGTLDKLESIPGFRVNLSLAEFAAQAASLGLAMMGQTAELAPADRKLYALRDTTATVECDPLICASIMGKKLAEGIDALVLDVKFGRGAFMPTIARARQLAEALVGIGRSVRKPVRAVLTAMDQPLGRTVGNALELIESIEFLHGSGPADVEEVTLALGEQMLLLTGVAADAGEARRQLRESIASGAAWAKFRAMVAAQGGDVAAIDDPSRLPQARLQAPLVHARGGYVRKADALEIARASLRLGAGRTRAEEPVDPAVGISHLVKVGEMVPPGGSLCTIHAADEDSLAEARKTLEGAIALGDEPVAAQRLVEDIIWRRCPVRRARWPSAPIPASPAAAARRPRRARD